MSDMEKFFTRSVANKGIKIPLFLPNGEESDEFLRIRGIDSDSFRDANTRALREAPKIIELESVEEQDAMVREAHLDVLASLVISWSFEDECTTENIKKLFREAPQIADAVDRAAAKRMLFFDNGLQT